MSVQFDSSIKHNAKRSRPVTVATSSDGSLVAVIKRQATEIERLADNVKNLNQINKLQGKVIEKVKASEIVASNAALQLKNQELSSQLQSANEQIGLLNQEIVKLASHNKIVVSENQALLQEVTAWREEDPSRHRMMTRLREAQKEIQSLKNFSDQFLSLPPENS